MNINAKLRFITPCFCAGANQLRAEIRAPSLRGQLRWWFRCLGGTPEDEATVFGTVAGTGRASEVIVRVFGETRAAAEYAPDYVELADPGAYLHYYLGAETEERPSRVWINPPDQKTKRKGVPRTESYIPSGSTFHLNILTRRALPAKPAELLDVAVNALLHFGSLGYRQTRGFGAWHLEKEGTVTRRADLEQAATELQQRGFRFWFAKNNQNDVKVVLNHVESKLKLWRKPETPAALKLRAKDRTALGFSLEKKDVKEGQNQRQASAVHFRPVQFTTNKGDAQFTLCIFQAPRSVLGPDIISPVDLVPGHVPP